MERVTLRIRPLNLSLEVPRGSQLRDVLNPFGVEFPCGGRGVCGGCKVRIPGGAPDPDPAHQRRLKIMGLGPDWRLACMTGCDSDMVVEVEQFQAVIQTDDTPFSFTPREGYGVAVDLGTTTLVAQLVDLSSGQVLSVETGLNPQRKYGSDLVSRLEAALDGNGGQMQQLIRQSVAGMVRKLCQGRTRTLSRALIAGNTVMQHLFCGLDVRPLSHYPFSPPDPGLIRYASPDLGWEVSCGEILFLPFLGSYVGSDVLAGIHATGILTREKYSVLIDLGTNGEIAAGNREGLLCTSTAAGPAFEGAHISCGMLASSGAIASVYQVAGGASYRTIRNAPARGICGSGLIDAAAVMLDEGIIGAFGEILSGDPSVELAPSVRLSQRDIQEFQLAKAAIATGTEILLGELGLVPGDIERVYIAGAFGTFINLDHVVRTGMLPFPADRIRQRGNTALMGARMLLFGEEEAVDAIRRSVRHVQLEAMPAFQDLYVEHMTFPT